MTTTKRRPGLDSETALNATAATTTTVTPGWTVGWDRHCLRYCVPDLMASGVAARLIAAGRPVRCPDDGCPLCRSGGDITCVLHCEAVSTAVGLALQPELQSDPRCLVHYLPTLETAAGCSMCVDALFVAGLWGWSGPTGHDGEDCLHCVVCGLCKASGRVCRDCLRCDEHAESAWEYPNGPCWRLRWDRLRRVRVAVHSASVWDPATRRWCA